jgi:hypothetical protein
VRALAPAQVDGPVQTPGPLCVRAALLKHFQDAPRLRDPRGRTRRPSLVPVRRDGRVCIDARGPFLMLHRFRVTRDQGVRFCETTGDANPIHFEGDVIPGAYTAAKLLVGAEVLFAEHELASFSMKFTAMGHYDLPLFGKVRVTPGAGGVRLTATTSQEGKVIASMEAELARVPGGAPIPRVKKKKVNMEQLRAVRGFLRSVGVHPSAYLGRRGVGGYTYPRGYLAALPSGEMVRQLSGEGGLLNKLTLQFETAERLPIIAAPPSVTLEQPQRRARKAFQRIMAAISQSVHTYVTGTALVLRGSPALLPVSARPARPLLLPG